MKHLTMDEVIAFVMLDCEMDSEELAWALTVNDHIRFCPTCLEAVQTHQRLYEAFLELKDGGRYTDFLSKTAMDGSFEYRTDKRKLRSDTEADGLR